MTTRHWFPVKSGFECYDREAHLVGEIRELPTHRYRWICWTTEELGTVDNVQTAINLLKDAFTRFDQGGAPIYRRKAK